MNAASHFGHLDPQPVTYNPIRRPPRGGAAAAAQRKAWGHEWGGYLHDAAVKLREEGEL
ncbi:MAG: hypothetical protein ACRDUT_00035 [Mycobacterium sp.]